MKTPPRVYGINVVTLFPWSLGPGGFQRSVALATAAGFNGLQVLPLRGWGSLDALDASKVISFEDAWNGGSFSRALFRSLRLLSDVAAPSLLDWILFGPRASKTFQLVRSRLDQAFYVAHDFGSNTILEINPEAGISTMAYKEYPHGLCWDTLHVRRPCRGSSEEIRNWKTLLKAVVPQIKLIHVHPVRGEVAALLSGDTSFELVYMLELLGDVLAKDVPVILEVNPFFLNFHVTKSGAVGNLSALLKAVKAILD